MAAMRGMAAQDRQCTGTFCGEHRAHHQMWRLSRPEGDCGTILRRTGIEPVGPADEENKVLGAGIATWPPAFRRNPRSVTALAAGIQENRTAPGRGGPASSHPPWRCVISLRAVSMGISLRELNLEPLAERVRAANFRSAPLRMCRAHGRPRDAEKPHGVSARRRTPGRLWVLRGLYHPHGFEIVQVAASGRKTCTMMSPHRRAPNHRLRRPEGRVPCAAPDVRRSRPHATGRAAARNDDGVRQRRPAFIVTMFSALSSSREEGCGRGASAPGARALRCALLGVVRLRTRGETVI